MTGGEPASTTAPEKLVDVLIVENDRETLDMFVDILRAHRCLVRGAANLHEAEAALRERVPDVLLCDLHLGRGDSGSKLAERMREDPRTRHVGRIAMTGRLHPTLEVVRAFDEYMRKPLGVPALVEKVSKLAIASRRAARVAT